MLKIEHWKEESKKIWHVTRFSWKYIKITELTSTMEYDKNRVENENQFITIDRNLKIIKCKTMSYRYKGLSLTKSILYVLSMFQVNSNTSQMIADRSFDDEAKYFPLCENCKNHTSSVWACSIWCKRNDKKD